MELISKDEVMRLVENGKLLSGSFGERAKDIIKSIPTIEERKEGKWIDTGENLHKCSNCGQIIFSQTPYDLEMFHAYCGRCGARMKGE